MAQKEKSTFIFSGIMSDPRDRVTSEPIRATSERQAYGYLERLMKEKFNRRKIVFGAGVTYKITAGPLAKQQEPRATLPIDRSAVQAKPAFHAAQRHHQATFAFMTQ